MIFSHFTISSIFNPFSHGLIITFFRASKSIDAETSVKFIEAYFCTGDPYWPMRLSPEDEHSVLRSSVVLAHFMICNQTRHFPDEENYREKMIEQLEKEIHVFHSVLDKTTEKCMSDKTECIFYEHLCGKDKAWNFENLIKFLEFSFEGHSHPFLKILWYGASFLLKGNNSEIFLSSVAEYCPERSTYCGRSSRKKRETTTEIKKYFESPEVLSRNKRLFDPGEMMRLFNKVVCSREIMDALAEYWDTHYDRFSYSRVWIMRIEADIWCCIVHNLEKSY